MRRCVCALWLLLAWPVAAAPNGLVALLTDYGADTIYVGILRGAILSKNGAARVETVTNSVPNYDIVTGAHLLAEASPQWPKGTTFCCVVDPGVGTPRKSIVLETKAGQYFVGPDNGLLSLVAQRDGIAALHEATNPAYFGPNAVSSTFQGRDIYGPVAASIAGGAALAEVGPALTALVEVEVPEASVEAGAMHGTVLRSDDYGNLITNIPAARMVEIGVAKGDTVSVQIGEKTLTLPYRNTYAEVAQGEALLCAQSVGLVEAAINQGSMAALTGAGPHTPVVIRKADAQASVPQGEALLVFVQSGGITGRVRELRVDAQGGAQVAAPRRDPAAAAAFRGVVLSKKDFRALRDLAAAAFGAPEPAPAAGGPRMGGADYQTYTIRYAGQEKTFTDLDTPEAFRALLRALTGLAAKHGG